MNSTAYYVQVRECATALLHVAKRQGVPVFLVGHVTKTGTTRPIAFAALMIGLLPSLSPCR